MSWAEQRRGIDEIIANSDAARAATEARKPPPEPDVHCLREECGALIGPAMRARPEMFGVVAIRVGDVAGWVCGQECRRRIDWRLKSTGQAPSVLLTGAESPVPAHVRPPLRVAVGPSMPSTPATEPPGSTRRLVARCSRNECSGETAIDQEVSRAGAWSPDAPALLRLGGWVTDPQTGKLYCSRHCMTWVQAVRARETPATHPGEPVAVLQVNDVSYRESRARARAREGLEDETTPAAPPVISRPAPAQSVTPALAPAPAVAPSAESPKPSKRSR